MAGKVLGKFMEVLGLEDEADDDEEINESGSNTVLDREPEEKEDEEILTTSRRQGKVVNIHSAAAAKVVICKPMDFDEATNICDDLRNRKIVVVNATCIEPKITQRLMDFLSGACYAFNAELQEIEKGIYILSPSNVMVNNELKSELSNKGLFNLK